MTPNDGGAGAPNDADPAQKKTAVTAKRLDPFDERSARREPMVSGATAVPSGMETSRLRQALEAAVAQYGCSMRDLTVLAPQNDPFRLDTPSRHRDGAWLAATARDLGLRDRLIHLRGLHYMVLGQPKPDGMIYTNTEPDWLWLSQDAGKAARWLGYLPFEQIVDQRNAAPEVQTFSRPEPTPYLSVGVTVDIPDADNITPLAGVHDFTGVQPFKLVLIGEKSSLNEVLGPVARDYRADLYLPTGEISDTQIHHIAATADADGRPLRVFYFADADPAGWQMGISVSRKLQAFKTLHYPSIDFQVHRVALTPDQVQEYGLPSTPLKASEKRGGAWRAAFGIEQTEIDALAALRPDLLRQIARDALDPFFDHTLDERVNRAHEAWLDQAQAVLDEQLDARQLQALRAEAAATLTAFRQEIDAINDALRVNISGDITLPTPAVPTAVLNEAVYPVPLLDSRWSFSEQCRRLNESKGYRVDGAEGVA